MNRYIPYIIINGVIMITNNLLAIHRSSSTKRCMITGFTSPTRVAMTSAPQQAAMEEAASRTPARARALRGAVTSGLSQGDAVVRMAGY